MNSYQFIGEAISIQRQIEDKLSTVGNNIDEFISSNNDIKYDGDSGTIINFSMIQQLLDSKDSLEEIAEYIESYKDSVNTIILTSVTNSLLPLGLQLRDIVAIIDDPVYEYNIYFGIIPEECDDEDTLSKFNIVLSISIREREYKILYYYSDNNSGTYSINDRRLSKCINEKRTKDIVAEIVREMRNSESGKFRK